MSEGAAQLAVIGGAFLLTFALVRLTRMHPIAIGCLLPLLAGAGVWTSLLLWPPESSTAPVAIPFIILFAALGSVPAAFLAGFLTGRLK